MKGSTRSHMLAFAHQRVQYKMNVECLVVLKPSSKRCSIRRVFVCLVQLRSFRVLCMPTPRVPHLSNP